ncbi:MAG: hypothetical protein KGP28_03680 [Bdellovibrionales bacterium]|nr:hypothetical protein [Bdellovibrionales bacterium]
MRPGQAFKKQTSGFQRFLFGVLVFQLGISSPFTFQRKAWADSINEEQSAVCDPINQKQGLNPDPSVPVRGYQECKTAEHSRIAKRQANAKAIMFGAMSASCAALAIWEPSGIACTAISLAGTGAKMLMDRRLTKKIGTDTQYEQNKIAQGSGYVLGAAKTMVAREYITLMKDKVMNVIGSLGATNDTIEANANTSNAPAQTQAPQTQTTSTGTETKSVDQSQKNSCFIQAGILALEMGFAIVESIHARTFQKNYTSKAKEEALLAQSSGGAIGNEFGRPSGAQQNPAALAAADGVTTSSANDCDSSKGNSYLTCIFKGSSSAPAISALIGNEKLNKVLETMTNGKTLGDLAKGYPGDVSGAGIGTYLAGAMGLPASTAAALSKSMDQIEKDALKEAESIPGAVYASKGNPEPAKSGVGELDFTKMMDGMLKQLNPEEKSGMLNQENTSEAVFRKLDLLPPDKIEANRDISLFVRIGHRYRKKTPSILSPAIDGSNQDNNRR